MRLHENERCDTSLGIVIEVFIEACELVMFLTLEYKYYGIVPWLENAMSAVRHNGIELTA